MSTVILKTAFILLNFAIFKFDIQNTINPKLSECPCDFTSGNSTFLSAHVTAQVGIPPRVTSYTAIMVMPSNSFTKSPSGSV